MTIDQIRQIPAIDVHSHFGANNCEPGSFYSEQFEDGRLKSLQRNMGFANIAVSVNSHMFTMMPRGKGDAVRGNEMIIREAEHAKGIYFWAVVNPLQPESYAQAADMLQHPKVLGIKVHPEEHLYPIREHGEAIYQFAAKHNAVIITHSGEANSLPEDFCVFANRYPETKTITSHLGCGFDGSMEHQIRAIEMNEHDNLFTDTSSSRSIMHRLIEFAVERIGSEKILFGTDSTCYFSPSQRARIDFADISETDKCNILYRNALRHFPFLKPIYEKETGIQI